VKIKGERKRQGRAQKLTLKAIGKMKVRLQEDYKDYKRKSSTPSVNLEKRIPFKKQNHNPKDPKYSRDNCKGTREEGRGGGLKSPKACKKSAPISERGKNVKEE